MRFRKLASLVGVLALASLAAPAGMAAASAQTMPRTWTVQVGEESANRAIQGMAFLPQNVFIHPGDTVDWVANSAEIHTVTFLADQTVTTPPAFDPADPNMLFPVGGSAYQGGMYLNSGLLANIQPGGFPYRTSYRLSFPATGNFTYFCLVHGEMMKGVVHVIPASRHYPYTQKQYNHEARKASEAILRDGRALAAATRESVEHSHTVALGADDGVAMVMRFIQPVITVHVGQRVTFKNTGMAAPHTVTFGTEPANFFPPSGDPTHYRGGDLNSGIVPPHGSFTVTFTKAGSYAYICALHDYMGMVGKVNVVTDEDDD